MAERSQERRERDRAYAASYRARKRAEAAERARVASDGEPGQIRQAVEASFAAAKWLTGSDAAAVAQARALANMADRTHDERLQLRAHALLSRLLSELGLTPRVRMQLELRARKLDTVNAATVVAATGAAIEGASNVTRFPRPAPRRQ